MIALERKIGAGVLALLLGGAWAVGQAPATTEPAIPVGIDMGLMLRSPEVLAERVEAGVWRVERGAERMLIQVPVVAEASGDGYELTSSTLRVRGGRFIAWRIPAEGQEGGEIPRLARLVQVGPDGKLSWGMERVIPGATVREGEGDYQIKLDPRAMERMTPGRPETLARQTGEDNAAYQARRAEQARNYREQMRQFSELRKRVAELPTTFEQAGPRLWAIFELRENAESLEVEGPAPLPWSIKLALLKQLRGAMGGSGAASDAGGAWMALADYLAGAPCAYAERLAGEFLRLSGVLGQESPGETALQLARRVLASGDAAARRQVIVGLAAGASREATRELIEQAVRDSDVGNRGLALSARLRDTEVGGQQLTTVVRQLSEAMASAGGAVAGEVLTVALDAARERADLARILPRNLDLGSLGAEQQKAAAKVLVARAEKDAVAGAVLDRQMLGSGSETARLAALRELAAHGQAQTAPAEAWWGSPKKDAGQGLITLGARHALLEILEKGSEAERELAWRSLGKFRLAEGEEQGAATGEKVDAYERITQAGLKSQPTPVELVSFLVRQGDEVRRTRALVRLVMEGDAAAGAEAGRALMNEGAALGEVMGGMSPQQREELGRRLYERVAGAVPETVGLLAEGGEKPATVEWFANEVKGGNLPAADQWAQGAGGAKKLIAMCGEGDGGMCKKAAAAALVAGVGGSAEDRAKVAEMLMGARQAPEKAYEEWVAAKRKMLLGQIGEGTYTVQVLWTAVEALAAEAQDEIGGSTLELGRVALKVGEAGVSLDRGMVGVRVPDEAMRPMLRIEKPAELVSLGEEAWKKMPLEKLRPIDLVRQADGKWTGVLRTEGGEVGTLSLVPVGGTVTAGRNG